MKKTIITDVERCTGCKLCMLACSFRHERRFSLMNSRIQVRIDKVTNINVPFICEQCGEHTCVDACPIGAIYYDNDLTIFRVDPNRCTGCGSCVQACPYNGIFLNMDGKASKCDLCEGDPTCVKYCILPQAIRYGEINTKNVMEKSKGIFLKLRNGEEAK